MTIIRPDAPELLAEATILIGILRNDNQPETREQNLNRMERIVDMLATSIEDRSAG